MFNSLNPSNNNRTSKDKKLSPLLKQALDDPQRQEYNLNVTFHDEHKRTCIKGWNKWSEKKQTEKQLKNSYKESYTCYGFVTGYNGLFGVDFDWEWPYYLCKEHFGERFDTYTVKTPNQGYRCLFITKNPKNNDDFKNNLHVELQGGKAAIVAGKANDAAGNIQEYKPVKTDHIRKEPEIQRDIINFFEETLNKCSFIKYKCISSCLGHKKNNLSHDQRTSIASLFIARGINDETAINFFRTCPNFNYNETETHIKNLHNKGFTHPKCDTLCRNFHWDENNCSGCIRKKNKVKNSSEKKNLTTLIVQNVQQKAELLMDDREVPYARFNVGKHHEIWPIGSKRFTAMLYQIGMPLNENKVPNSDAVSNAVRYLEALAFQKDEIKLDNRVAESENAFWYDLSNNEWQAVKITTEGFKVVNNPPAIFRREKHQKAQVHPNVDGDPWKFFEFVNVPDEKKLLLLVYIIACFIPDIPHPVIIIFGPQGSGKSILMEFMRLIIDPSKAPKLKIPHGDKDIVQTFDHHYAAFFDNLETITTRMSDLICRAVTGEGSEYRALYTDDDAVIRTYRRCVGLNGINVAATKGDLLNRGIFVSLKQISDEHRDEEEKLRKKFGEELPSILGGIFRVISAAMAIYPSVELEELPRMADFAKWGYAIAEALDSKGNAFITAYSKDEKDRIMETLDANPLSTAILALMEENEEYKGTPTELLKKLEDLAEDEKINTKSKTWPKSPSWVTKRLKEVESALLTAGIIVEQRRNGQKRTITLHKVPQNDECGVSSDTAVTKPNDDGNDSTDTKIPHLEYQDIHKN